MNAPEKATEIKALLTAAVSFIVALLGWVGIAVAIMIACMLLDYITGTWAAKAHAEWSSEKARAGLWHKLGEIVALLVAALCDIAVGVILSSARCLPESSCPIGSGSSIPAYSVKKSFGSFFRTSLFARSALRSTFVSPKKSLSFARILAYFTASSANR